MHGARRRTLRHRCLVVAAGAVCTALFAAIYLPLLPNSAGGLGHDYSYFLPQLLAGSYWMQENGPLAVPWFTPAWLGGVPFYPNPQNLYHTVPQQLCALTDPLSAVRVTAVLFFGVGFGGTYRLLRGAFRASRPAAVFGAVLFAFNGYYAHRMLIGHVVYHAFMLTPWIAHWMLRPQRTDRESSRSGRLRSARLGVLAGAGLAYLFHSADLYGLPIVVGVVIGLALMRRLSGSAARLSPVRGVVAVTTALALCAAKLVPMAALLAAFPRTGYALPGADGLVGSLRLALLAVFGTAPTDTATDVLVNTPWAIQRHELEYGLSPVALIAIVVGGITLLRRGARPARMPTLALIALLASPVVLNVHTPAWESFLKSVPLLGSSSNLLRTFTLYVLPGAVAAAVFADRALRGARVRVVVLGVAAVAAIGWHARVDRSYYAEQWYDPARVVAAWRSAQASNTPPAVTHFVTERDASGAPTMTVGRNDALTAGASQLAAFEPVFGYRLEWFPFGDIREGPAIQQTAAGLNVKHPARFLYPEENGGAPGTEFPPDERSHAESLLAYRPFPFEVPLRQRVADVVSVLALFVGGGLLAVDAIARRGSTRLESESERDEE